GRVKPPRAGGWFTLGGICRGDVVTVFVNGKPSSRLEVPKAEMGGYIALQQPDKPTGVEVRSIEIKKPAPPAAAERALAPPKPEAKRPEPKKPEPRKPEFKKPEVAVARVNPPRDPAMNPNRPNGPGGFGGFTRGVRNGVAPSEDGQAMPP